MNSLKFKEDEFVDEAEEKISFRGVSNICLIHVFLRVVFSEKLRGFRLMISILPARESATFGRFKMLADPVKIKPPGILWLSMRCLRGSIISGARCISSMIVYSDRLSIKDLGSIFAEVSTFRSSRDEY